MPKWLLVLQTSMLGNVWKGVPLVTMQSFDFPRFLELIQQHRCTRLHVVPPIALGLAKLPLVSEYDVSSCRTAMCAAAPLATEVQQAVAERLGIVIKQGWGMTELSPLATIELDCHPHRPGSVGPPCASTAIKVRAGRVLFDLRLCLSLKTRRTLSTKFCLSLCFVFLKLNKFCCCS